MNDLIVNNVKVNLVARNGSVFANSLDVANVFEKPHKDVLTKIRSFSERAGRNFSLSEYTDVTGRKLPMLEMNRDGFIFLVSGFTGEKAEDWKLDLIDGINAMEASLRELTKPMSQLEMVIASAQAMMDTQNKVQELEHKIDNVMVDVLDAVKSVQDKQQVPKGFLSLDTIKQNWETGMSREILMRVANIYNVETTAYLYQRPEMYQPKEYLAYKATDMKWALSQFVRTLRVLSNKFYYSPQIDGGATRLKINPNIFSIYGINDPRNK
jgi:Rha family phage regulatory protein